MNCLCLVVVIKDNVASYHQIYSNFIYAGVFPTTHVVKHGHEHLIFSGALKTIFINYIRIYSFIKNGIRQIFPHQTIMINFL